MLPAFHLPFFLRMYLRDFSVSAYGGLPSFFVTAAQIYFIILISC